jgi:hypothetical protein
MRLAVLRPSEEGARDLWEDKQKENKSLESLHSADLKKRSGRLLFWRRASKP